MIQFSDTVTLVLTEPGDGYGTEVEVDRADVSAAVDLNTGYSHGANQDAVTSDATVFLDPDDDFVSDNYYRLEEFLVLIDLFHTPERRAWYKVISVNVARDTQLCNEVDHIELSLKKTEALHVS